MNFYNNTCGTYSWKKRTDGAYSPSANVMGSSSSNSSRRRKAVIVTGVRTPFVRAFDSMMDVDAVGLGCAAVSGLLNKTKLDPNHIDEIIWGNVGSYRVMHACMFDL